MRNIIILGNAYRPARRIATEIISKGHNAYIINPKHIVGFNRDNENIYVSAGRHKEPISIPRDSISAVVPYCRHSIVQYFTDILKIPFTNSYQAINLAGDKYHSSIVLSKSVRTPKEALIGGNRFNVSLLERDLGYPCIIKTVRGSQGSGVWLVQDSNQAKSLVDILVSKGIQFIAQEFVRTENAENKPHDYRLFCIDGRVVASMKRIATTGIKTNDSIHKNSIKHVPNQHMKNIALQAMRAVGLNIGGVDLAKNSETGRWMTYEVNSCPGVRIEKVSDVNVASMIADYAISISRSVTTKIPASISSPKISEFKNNGIDSEMYGVDDFLIHEPSKIKSLGGNIIGEYIYTRAFNNSIEDYNTY